MRGEKGHEWLEGGSALRNVSEDAMTIAHDGNLSGNLYNRKKYGHGINWGSWCRIVFHDRTLGKFFNRHLC